MPKIVTTGTSARAARAGRRTVIAGEALGLRGADVVLAERLDHRAAGVAGVAACSRRCPGPARRAAAR